MLKIFKLFVVENYSNEVIYLVIMFRSVVKNERFVFVLCKIEHFPTETFQNRRKQSIKVVNQAHSFKVENTLNQSMVNHLTDGKCIHPLFKERDSGSLLRHNYMKTFMCC